MYQQALLAARTSTIPEIFLLNHSGCSNWDGCMQLLGEILEPLSEISGCYRTYSSWNANTLEFQHMCTKKVLDKYDAIISFYESDALTAKGKSKMEPHISALKDANGLEALQDTVTILEPLMDITIDEEGEYYITSSSAIPKLHQAKHILDAFLTYAQRNSSAGGKLRNPGQTASWIPTIKRLWDVYLQPFMEDELFQVL